MEIRQASAPDEIATARSLFAEYADALPIDLSYQGFADELDDLPGKYAPPQGRLLIGWDGSRAAGCIALRPLSQSTCEVKRLYVRRDLRRSGAGRQLAEAVVAEAKQLGYDQVLLDTLPTMEPAIRLYESLGFRRCDAYYATPIADTVFMSLDLKPRASNCVSGNSPASP